MSFKRTSVSVGERSARFPLPFGRGEDQGEGLVRQTLASLTKWKCTLTLSPEKTGNLSTISLIAFR